MLGILDRCIGACSIKFDPGACADGFSGNKDLEGQSTHMTGKGFRYFRVW